MLAKTTEFVVLLSGKRHKLWTRICQTKNAKINFKGQAKQFGGYTSIKLESFIVSLSAFHLFPTPTPALRSTQGLFIPLFF